MVPSFSDIVEEARLSARALLDYGDSFFSPTVRLGVTGLSRAGKTVFITALIHGLTRGGRFPIFEPYATGRIARARLAPQPDDAVPRFAYENHVRTLIEERRWPNSTIDISELRLVIDYQRQNGADDGGAPDGSLWAMMRRRYEAYKDVVVRPFFRDHFARLDRQIVLVDALAAFNAGPEALHDLEAALSGILDCFRIGRSTILSSLFRPRIDRILFAATKADHLHHQSHDRLEAVLRRAVAKAAGRAAYAGAAIDVVALSAVRATRRG